MEALIIKDLYIFLSQNLSFGVVLSFFLFLIIIRASLKLDKRFEQIDTNTKQVHKTVVLISSCPCISKRNATWLQDKNQNGGQAPEAIECVYLKDMGK